MAQVLNLDDLVVVQLELCEAAEAVEVVNTGNASVAVG